MKNLDNKPFQMTSHEWILHQLSEKYNVPVKDVKKMVNHNFAEMSKAFGKESITSIEWVGMGNFTVNQGRLKYYISRLLSKFYIGKIKLKEEYTRRMEISVKLTEQSIELATTKLKDDKVIEYLRGVEEQLITRVTGEGIDLGDSKRKIGNL